MILRLKYHYDYGDAKAVMHLVSIRLRRDVTKREGKKKGESVGRIEGIWSQCEYSDVPLLNSPLSMVLRLYVLNVISDTIRIVSKLPSSAY